MDTRLECGHTVDVEVGVRLWCYYDTTFGVVSEMPQTWSKGWFSFVCDGSPYKAAGSRGSYDPPRLACVPCGVRELTRRVNDRLTLDAGTFGLTRTVL